MTNSLPPDWSLEEQLWREVPAGRLAGIDEAGRGALAGPVVVAAVILEPHRQYDYRDSKTLQPAQRDRLAALIRAEAVAYAVAYASAAEVDEFNVLGATHLAALRAVAALQPPAAGLVTDYLRLVSGLPELAVARGDQRSFQIAAASILAKVGRDTLMRELDARHPGYGFASNKGYGSARHLRGLAELGHCFEHRLTFAPVARCALTDHHG